MKKVTLLAASLVLSLVGFAAPASAGDVAIDNSVRLDPFDPVPQIGFRHDCEDECGYHRCHQGCYRHHYRRRCEDESCCDRDCWETYWANREVLRRYERQADTWDMLVDVYVDALRRYDHLYLNGHFDHDPRFREDGRDGWRDGHREGWYDRDQRWHYGQHDGDDGWFDLDHHWHDGNHHDGAHEWRNDWHPDGEYRDGDGHHDGDRHDGDGHHDGDNHHDGDGHHDGDWHDDGHHDSDHHDGDHHDGDHHHHDGDGGWYDRDGNWHDAEQRDGYPH